MSGGYTICDLVALITEVAPVAIVPNFVLQRKLLQTPITPFREQTGGTVLVSLSISLFVHPAIKCICVCKYQWCVIIGIQAGKLARDRGWSINIGGGFHHCSTNEGGGFCAYADITLCVKVTSMIA